MILRKQKEDNFEPGQVLAGFLFSVPDPVAAETVPEKNRGDLTR